MAHLAGGGGGGGGTGRLSPTAASQVYSNYMVQRPQSQAGQNDGSERNMAAARPESRMSGLGGERVASPAPDGPFNHLQDYTKLNTGQHQATRSDTFGTPSRLERRVNTAKADGRAMHDIFEHGFAKSVQQLGKTILEEVRAELNKTVVQLRKDVSTTMTGLAATRDTAAGDILDEVLKKLQFLGEQQIEVREQLKAQQQPVIEYLQTIHTHIGDGDERHNEGRRDLTETLEQRLTHSFELVSQQVEAARVQQEQDTAAELSKMRQEVSKALQATETLNDEVRRSEAQLGVVSTQQFALSIANDNAAEQVRKFQEENKQQFQDLRPFLQDQNQQLTKQIDFSPVLVEIARIGKAVNGDMGTLEEVLGEIGKVQKALFIDYLKKDAKGGMAESDGEGEMLPVQDGVRVREIFTQTDKYLVDRDMMTDPVKFEDPNKARQNSLRPKKPPKTSAVKALEMAKKKPSNVIDGDAMKRKMQEALLKGEYNVCNLYHDKGWAQKIARSSIFENLTFLVIFLNAIWIAVDTDHNDAPVLIEAHVVFIIAENCFCGYFSWELFVRFLAFKRKRSCCKDGWFMFDGVLVTLMMLETWIITIYMASTGGKGSSSMGNLSILRMARLVKMLRMARMARLLRSVPELVVLIKTIGVASRSVFFFIVFWIIILYIFGVAFRQLTKETVIGKRYFPTVPASMNTLLLDGILPVEPAFVNRIAGANSILWPCFIIFVVIASLTVMNMLIGVIVEVVAVVASTEKEKMSILGLQQDLKEAMEALGVDHKKSIPHEQFATILISPEMLSALGGFDVDPMAVADAAEVIFAEMNTAAEMESSGSLGEAKDGLSFEVLIDLVLKMRGKNPATVKDVKESTRIMKAMVGKMEESIKSVKSSISSQMNMMQGMGMTDDGHFSGSEYDQSHCTTFNFGDHSAHTSSQVDDSGHHGADKDDEPVTTTRFGDVEIREIQVDDEEIEEIQIQ